MSQIDNTSKLDGCPINNVENAQMKNGGHKKNKVSIDSTNSIKSLNEEGFNRKKETESEKMWKMVETLRNNSTLFKEKIAK